MQLIKKNNKNKISPTKGTVIWEYPSNDLNINGATAEINGRYPNKGLFVNQESTELVYVVKGQGKLVCENKTYKFQAGDMLIIKAEEKYFWQGNFTICMANTPKWTPEQHQIVKNK